MPDEVVAETQPLETEDLMKSLMGVDEPAPVEPEKPAETPGPEKAEAVEPAAEPEKPVEPETPKPGTPDKALQKLQQDMAATQRSVEKLLEKANAGEPLTAKEQQQAADAARKLDQLRAKAQEKFDMFEDGAGETLVSAVLETSDDISAVKSELAQVKQMLHQQQVEQTWKDETAKYPGVNVKEVWEKAWKESIETLGEDATEKSIYNLAMKQYTERATAATKSVAAKTPAKPALKPAPTPITPQGGRTTLPSTTTGPVMSDDEALERSYLEALTPRD